MTRRGALLMTAAGLLSLAGAGARAADRRQVRTEEVRVPAGDVVLAGALHRPERPGRNPGVVIVHGSGPTTREAAGFWTDLCIACGLVTLVLDKRGTGKSTGVYEGWDVKTTEAMFGRLAADAEHAVRWLARQPGVDASRLGLVGGSQAGWVMPLAASREPSIRFLFIGEGVPLAAGIEEAHSTYLDGVAIYGKSRPTLRQIAAADAFAEDYIGERGFDPSPILERLEIPVMWTYGLYDEAIPTRPASIASARSRRPGGRTSTSTCSPSAITTSGTSSRASATMSPTSAAAGCARSA